MAEETLFTPEDGVTAAVIKRSELRPGDLLVLAHPGHLTDGVYSRLVETTQRVLGNDIKVILLEEGMTVDSILSLRGE